MYIYRRISTHMIKMINLLIKWGEEYNYVISELGREGIFITNYFGHPLCTYINTSDDKHRSISTDNRRS